ncbi:hypothetical protein [Roseibium algae]|uniref:Uncharacterized protein n=1 Tax=Roseibium algae TaxID=3123038 RepID=A0ABU8TQ37_9HYPH
MLFIQIKPLTHAAALGSCVLLASTAANGQARPDTRDMTCTQAQALVKQRGEVVMTTGQYTFERFIADARTAILARLSRDQPMR